MKKTIFLVVLFVAALLQAQNPETDSNNWQVTKLANTDQLVSFPNEITYGPDGWLWITERATNDDNDDGTLYGERVVRVNPDTGAKTEMIDLHNEVYSDAGQDGLMGMAIHPDLFTDVTTTTNNHVYLALTYYEVATPSQPRRLRIVRFDFDNTTKTLVPNSRTVIIEDIEASNDHNAGRLKIGPDLKLYYSVGDLGWNQFANKCKRIQAQALPTQAMVNAQDWSTYKGKVLRMNLDGSVPNDNPLFYPFAPTDANPVPDNADTNRPDTDKVRSHVYSYGHRNGQGIIFDSLGNLYQSEHGERVDDEINFIIAGKNYGWPLIAGYRDNQGYDYCIKASDPNGCTIGGNDCPAGAVVHQEEDFATPADFKAPISTYNSTSGTVPQGGFLTWPTVAPSSIDVYEPQGLTNEIPWKKSILIPTLKKGTIYRYELNAAGDGVVGDLIEFHSSIDRYRDMTISPDGTTIYAITDSSGTTSGPSGSVSAPSLANPGAVIKIQYISSPEPSNQPTNFTATAQNGNINLSWTDATGTNPASGYVITAASDVANLPSLVDGTDLEIDADLTDGLAVVKVEPGNESYSFIGLTQGTTYHFQIHSYSNFGSDIDYLTAPAGPIADDTIPAFPTLYISEITNTLNNDNSNFVEIYNYGTEAVDLGASGISLARQAAGNPPTNYNVALSGIIQPGAYFVLGRSSFATEYAPLTADIIVNNNVLGGTGDDPYLLVYNGDFTTSTYDVIDIFGEVGVDGDNEPWNYVNSRITRKRNTTSNSIVWIEAEWEIIASSSASDNTPGGPDLIDFTYTNGWLPFDPSGITTNGDNATVITGNAALTSITQIGDLTIQSGQTLDLGNHELSVAGDLVNSGSIAATSGTLVFNGNTSQTVSGNDIEVQQLHVDNDVTINVNVDITGVLESNSGALTVNSANFVTLKSTATGTAFVDEVNGTINGTFKTERFVPAKRAFRFVSSSVTTTTSIYDNWQEGGSTAAGFGTHITGSLTGANGFDQSISGNVSIYGYDNVAQSWNSPMDTDNTNLVAGTPYRLFVRGDRTVDLSTNSSTPTNTVLRSTGTLKVGTTPMTNLSGVTGQFNFIGNPYQAPVDLSQVLSASTNVNPNFVYFWDPTINTRGAYVTVDVPLNSTNLSSNFNKYAQPHSSFFVTTLANGTASMTFNESHKEVSQEALNTFSVPNINPRVAIQLFESTEFAQGLRERDAAIVNINSSANNAVDAQDALKFTNLDENIAILNNNNLLSIEKRQSIQDDEQIELYTSNYRALQYNLKIDMTGIITPAYLYDSYLNTYTAIASSSATVYSFNVNQAVAASMDENRFRIMFSNTTLSIDNVLNDNKVSIYPNPTSNNIINVSGIDENVEIKLFNMLGQEISIPSQSIIYNGNNTQVSLPQSMVKGTYLLTLINDSSRVTHKVVIE